MIRLTGILFLIFAGCSYSQKEQESAPVFREISGDRFIISDNSSSIDSLNKLAVEEWSKANYQKSLNYVTVAYEKAKFINDEEALAKSLNILGLIYWRLGNTMDAMECYKESGNLATKLKLQRLLGLTHTNRSLIYKTQHNYEMAFFHNNMAIEIFKKSNYYKDLAIVLNNQGQIFKNKNNIDSARHYYLQALDNYRKIDYKDGAAATYYNLSDIYLKQGLKKASLDAAHKSLLLSFEAKSRVRTSEAYQQLSLVFEKFNQPDSALFYFKLFHSNNDSILIANQSDNLAKCQAELGAEVKNLQILNLEKEMQLAQNRIWFVGITVLILLMTSAFFIYRYLSKNKMKKRKLEIELRTSKMILNIKEQELKNYIIDLANKNSIINKLQSEITKENILENNDSKITQLLEQKILTEDDWEIFKSKFKSIYPNFFTRLKHFKSPFTEAEIRLMVLNYLDLSGKEMANTLGISPQSVRVCKMRLKKKLQLEGFDSVEDFLPQLTKEN